MGAEHGSAIVNKKEQSLALRLYMKLRLQKYISQAGITSRRKAEELIRQGKVKVNGKLIKEMGVTVDSTKDKVEVGSKKIKLENEFVYYALNKPPGFVCTRQDPKEKKTIYSLLPKSLKTKVWSVGRLDKMSEGLLILTNDGELTLQLTHPRFGHEKEYDVMLDKPFNSKQKITPAKVIKAQGKNLKVILKEGKKRQIRYLFDGLGYRVLKLKRVRVNKLKLGSLPQGKFKEINKENIL